MMLPLPAPRPRPLPRPPPLPLGGGTCTPALLLERVDGRCAGDAATVVVTGIPRREVRLPLGIDNRSPVPDGGTGR